MNTDVWSYLMQVIQNRHAQNLLFVGADKMAQTLQQTLASPLNLSHILHLEEVFKLEERYDLGLIWQYDMDTYGQKTELGLARLRDRHCPVVYLTWQQAKSQENAEQIKALALRIMSLGYHIEGSFAGEWVACFDIKGYKSNPAWLNAKGWANPVLWDKFRW